MLVQRLIAKWLDLIGYYPRRLRRLIAQTKLNRGGKVSSVKELKIELACGTHRLVFELRGPRLSVLGISDVIVERREIPQSLTVALLHRNASLHGCHWSLLRYATTHVFIVSAALDLRACSLRQFAWALEAILQELVYCREMLNRLRH